MCLGLLSHTEATYSSGICLAWEMALLMMTHTGCTSLAIRPPTVRCQGAIQGHSKSTKACSPLWVSITFQPNYGNPGLCTLIFTPRISLLYMAAPYLITVSALAVLEAFIRVLNKWATPGTAKSTDHDTTSSKSFQQQSPCICHPPKRKRWRMKSV